MGYMIMYTQYREVYGHIIILKCRFLQSMVGQI